MFDSFIWFPIFFPAFMLLAVFVAIFAFQRRSRKNIGSRRMQLIQRNHNGNVCHEIYQDIQTGVQYLIITTGNGFGYINAVVTPLLDSEGRPYVGRE